ncbi:hypothetical protein F5880DRAFT_1505945 [Lentinula raphanica]|nr:hypothetical protein F5880DRAFT_1505945 [Lentinula raphanica]
MVTRLPLSTIATFCDLTLILFFPFPLMRLPNELLHFIIEYIAYDPILPDSPSHSLTFLYTSPELLALSVANWQLRRICLPLLFANIRMGYTKNIRKLKEHIVLLSRYTKFLLLDEKFDHPASLFETGEQMLCQILPQFEHLRYVELRCSDKTVLYRAILAHPKVTSVLVYDLPPESMHDLDLSKVILDSHPLYSSTSDAHFESCLKHGMKVMELHLFRSEILTPGFELKTFPGLMKIELTDFLPASYDWLSVLSSNHSTLNELWLSDIHKGDLTRRTPPFISSFLKESQQSNLQKSLKVEEIGLCRTGAQFPQGSYIMGLTLNIASISLIDILTLVASSFPKLEALTLCPHSDPAPKATYHFNDIATVLRQFLCLRSLSLEDPFRILNFGNDESFIPIRPVDSSSVIDVIYARAETGVLWYASRIAKEVKSLDAIHFDESGFTHDGQESWYLFGWLHVLNGNRDVGGTIRRIADHPSREVFLETRMLPPGLL